MKQVSHGIDRIDATFDDPSLVANAGLLVVATLVSRLGLEALINDTVRLVGRIGGALPGRKILTLVHTIVTGGSHIDHADVLRAGATQAVLPFRVMAPSTLGTFLRTFTFGHVRQLDKVVGETIRRAWSGGAGPVPDERFVIDLDSTICETHGKQKQGVAYGYTRQLGHHPLLATRADTGEVLHARMRKGSSQRGHKRFVEELIARVRRCGASGELVLRADSGFWSNAIIDALDRLGVFWSITISQNKGVKAAIGGIAEDAWIDIDYTESGYAQVAECTYTTGSGRNEITRRMIVRRTRLIDPDALEMWPDWRHHAFITNLADDAVELDKFHRHHAVVELAIRDLKEGAGLEHCPSGKFFANAAWLACAVLAHNLIRWTASLGDIRDDDQLVVARRVRTRIVALPGRIVNHSGRQTLRLPKRWPWHDEFTRALDTLRALPLLA